MYPSAILTIAFGAVAMAAATDTSSVGPGDLLARDTSSVLEARFDACKRRCHNGKGHFPNQDTCKKQCHKCINASMRKRRCVSSYTPRGFTLVC